MDPEARVKRAISAYLKLLPNCWHNMPVPYGYGRPMLDYIGALCGRAFAIEAKAPGQRPTDRQEGTIENMQAAGMHVFVIDNERFPEFRAWVMDVLEAEGLEFP